MTHSCLRRSSVSSFVHLIVLLLVVVIVVALSAFLNFFDRPIGQKTTAGKRNITTISQKAATFSNTKDEPNNNNNALFSDQALLSVSDQEVIQTLVETYPQCRGKERLLSILVRASERPASEVLYDQSCDNLPKWSQVVSLYGDQPVIVGLDTCERYRSHLQAQRDGTLSIPPAYQNKTTPPYRQPRVAGLFNTGTNALAQTFMLNIEKLTYQGGDGGDILKPHQDFQEYNLYGGKHVPPKREWHSSFRDIPAKRWNVLPVVLIRDPFQWMQSMCRLGYNAKWPRGRDGHCPNLVPDEEERQNLTFRGMTTVPVDVGLKGGIFWDEYESLAALWSEWNRLYFDADFPRLMIRFEDTLYHAEQVMHQIKQCIGMDVPSNQVFHYQVDKAKTGRLAVDFAVALTRYGTPQGRFKGLESADRIYLQTALDPILMNAFHYAPLPTTLTTSPESSNVSSLLSFSFTAARSYRGELLTMDACRGKERLLDLLIRAGIEPSQILIRHCEALPTWSQIEERYGKEPVVYGQETCAKYRSTVQQEGRDPQTKVAGLFNAGSDILLSIIGRNMQVGRVSPPREDFAERAPA